MIGTGNQLVHRFPVGDPQFVRTMGSQHHPADWITRAC